jgi:transcriptional regulator with XRE-family HTH domain
MADNIAEGAFGRLLRYWRQVRRRSQEDVALEIDSSIKHISFLETGRSLPSRAIALRLAEYLGLSGRETNNLLMAAGFSPVNIEEFNVQESESLRATLIGTLRALDPFPSVILDCIGNVRMVNKGWLAIIAAQVPSILDKAQFNLADIILAEDGFRRYMDDWEDTAAALLVSLQQEVLMFEDAKSIATLQHYLANSAIPADWKIRGANRLTLSGMRSRITLPDDQPRDYMHVFNTVGSVRLVPDPALMIYSIIPMDDDVTEHWYRRLRKGGFSHPLLAY